MNKIRSEQVQIKMIAAGMVVLAIIMLLPLFAIAHYSVKSVDDFVYFRVPEALWQSTHSLFALCKEQFFYAVDYWKNWQGTYFSEWLVTVLMGICGDKYYFLGAYIALGGLVSAELMLFEVIFTKLLSADGSRSLIIALSCILMQILLMQAPVEAFYWYCGAGLYTWIYALAVLLAALLLQSLYKEQKGWRAAVRETGILFLSFAVGGSNFVISILVLVLWGSGIVLLWIYHHKERVRMSVNFLFFAGCMLLAICSPGNLKRVGAAGMEGYSVVESILRSLLEAERYIVQWTTLPYVIAGLMMAPLMLDVARKKKYRYPLPLLVTVITFGLYAAQFAPNLYSIGIIGAERVKNLYRTTMVLWIYGNELYWIGWLDRRRREKNAYIAQQQEIIGQERVSWMLPGWCVGLAAMVCALSLWGGETVTSVSAFQSLYRGQAQQYKAEYEARLEILRDESVDVAELEPYTYKPYILFFGDIVEDPEDWVNRSVADIFGKKAVKLKQE